MDIIVYCIAAVFVGILLWFVTKKNVKKHGPKDQKPQVAAPQGAMIGPGGVRRRQGRSRIQRNIERQQQLQEQQQLGEQEEKKNEDQDSDSNSESESELKVSSKKIGTKKQKKLQLKEEKRKVREATEREREKQKLEEEKQEQVRLKEEEREKLQEEKKAAELKRLKEEQEKREEEEYLKLAATFEIEEEGNEQGIDDEESAHALEDFINYVIESKVIFLEDLASHFGLRTQDAIEKVQLLLKEGRLTGVIDDRGKFIYITMDELKAVASFIERRGRVSISELARASNSLINIKVEKDLKLST